MHGCLAVQVRGSPAASKRSFLEKKGLTAAEIEEAFRRVPDTPSASVPAGPSGLPVQAAAEPPRKPFPTGTAATLQQLQPQQIVQQPPAPQPIRWTQVPRTVAQAILCKLWWMVLWSGTLQHMDHVVLHFRSAFMPRRKACHKERG